MRSFKTLSVLGFVLFTCASLFVIGCGSDDAPTTSNVGSLDDPEFLAVQEQVENFIDSTLNIMLTGIQSTSSISSGGNVDPILYGPMFNDSNSITISYVNGWHVVNLTNSTTDYAFNVIDSIQFYNDDAISQLGLFADSIWYRHHWSYDVSNKEVSYSAFEGYAGFDFRGLNSDEAVIDGTNILVADDQFVSDDSTVYKHFELSTDISSLTVAQGPAGWSHACPSAGTISTDVQYVYAKDDGADVLTEWSVDMVFTEGTAAVTVSSGGMVWTYTTDVCNSVY